jgi:hypothetical protein
VSLMSANAVDMAATICLSIASLVFHFSLTGDGRPGAAFEGSTAGSLS